MHLLVSTKEKLSGGATKVFRVTLVQLHPGVPEWRVVIILWVNDYQKVQENSSGSVVDHFFCGVFFIVNLLTAMPLHVGKERLSPMHFSAIHWMT